MIPLSFQQVKKKGVGLVEEKQIILHEEGRMDDAVAFSRSQDEESKTARVIRKCTALFNHFITGLDNMSASKRSSGFFRYAFTVVNSGAIMIGIFTRELW